MRQEFKTVVIDAGHGGTERVGGSSPNNAVAANGLLEKDLTLDIAQRTASVLSDSANVVLTRNSDVNLSLGERAETSLRSNASVFLSIHFNGSADKGIDGAEAFVSTASGPASERLAGNVLENLTKVTRSQNRGTKRVDLGVLLPARHRPQTAACLAEIAFLTNSNQAIRLEDASYRQHIAIALGDAVLNTLPLTSAAGSGLGYDTDDLDSSYFLSLDHISPGNPVFDIGDSVGKGGRNNEADVIAVKKRLRSLGFDWLTSDKNVDTKTVAAIKLFQTIIAGKNSISGDGKIDVGKSTHLWLQAKNAPRWQTMPAGSQAEGFFNFELSDTADTHDFGTDWMADTIRSAGAHYRDNYLKANSSAALFTVNDVSLPRGGNTPDHSGHEAGLACDLQLPKTDGKAGGINLTKAADRARFDRNAARAMLNALRAQALVTRIFLNDTDLIDEGLCARLAGHDDHIHFEVKPPARGAVELDGMGNYHSGGRLYQGSRQDDIDYRAHALDACGNSGGIAKNQMFVEYKDIKILSDLPRKELNVCLRWNDIPANTCEIDVVVHFHGYDLYGNKPFFKYVEGISGLNVSKRGRPTLCVLPFGRSFWREKDKNYGYSFPFVSGDKNGLQLLIDFSLKELAKHHKPIFGDLKMGRLILTAHSGGGAAVADILAFNKYPVDEVHLFDAIYACKEPNQECQYGPVNRWVKKKIAVDAKLSPADMPSKGGALRVVYILATASSEVKFDVSKLPAASQKFYRVEKTSCGHDDTAKIFGPRLLERADAELEKCEPKAKQKSFGLDYDEADYFSESEAGAIGLRMEDPRVAKEKISNFRAMRCEANRQLKVKWEKVKLEMVRIATEEFQAVWNNGANTETEAAMTDVIRTYWQDGVFPGEALPAGLPIPAESWSAAFIAWVVREAGGGDRFSRVHDEAAVRPRFRPRAHWRYVAPALINKTKLSQLNPFWAYAIDEVRPQVGDIVVKSRDGSGLTLNQLSNLTGTASDGNVGWFSHGDIVISVGVNDIRVIGGNVGDTVQESIIALNANGFVQSTGGANDDHMAIVRINTGQYDLPECA